MTPYLQLDLDSIAIDVQLAQRLPYSLSRYYLALPLGQDNGAVSVAMAYPQNVKARQILSRMLQAEIVPVFTPAEALLPLLEHIYHPGNLEGHDILSWCAGAQYQGPVRAAAAILAEAFQAKVTDLTASELNLDEILSVAASGRYELAVFPLPADPALPVILNQAATSLFFVSDEPKAIRRVLVVMRGYASDERALDWLTPFARRQGVTITLMPLTNGPDLDLGRYHHEKSPAQNHLNRCLQRLQATGVQVNLKFRQGSAHRQVVEEISGDEYDLLAIAAEADGGFVGQVVTAVEQDLRHPRCPIFVLKPPNYIASQPVNT